MKRRIVLVAVTAVLLLLSGCANPTGSNGGGDDDSGSTSNYTSPNIGTLVYVPAGRFQRDATETNISIISKPFRMSEHEVTQSQFENVMGVNPSESDTGGDTPNRPVRRIRWYDAIAFANKLSIEEGLTPVYSVTVGSTPIDWAALEYDDIPDGSDADWNAATADWGADGYRLPTEMEWMWAAMGGDQDAEPGAMQGGVNVSGYAKDFAGDDGSNSIDDYAWYDGNSDTGEGEITHPVGTKNANELGLYDMSGNVLEWTWDWNGTYPSGEVTDYLGPASSSNRVLRGGSYGVVASRCTVANRENFGPDGQGLGIGFRLVRP